MNATTNDLVSDGDDKNSSPSSTWIFEQNSDESCVKSMAYDIGRGLCLRRDANSDTIQVLIDLPGCEMRKTISVEELLAGLTLKQR